MKPVYHRGDRVRIVEGVLNHGTNGHVEGFRDSMNPRGGRSLEYQVFPDDGSRPGWYLAAELEPLDAITQLGEIVDPKRRKFGNGLRVEHATYGLGTVVYARWMGTEYGWQYHVHMDTEMCQGEGGKREHTTMNIVCRTRDLTPLGESV